MDGKMIKNEEGKRNRNSSRNFLSFLKIIHFFWFYIFVGSLVGAYFIGRQLPYFGPEVYYDVLTSAGSYFNMKSP